MSAQNKIEEVINAMSEEEAKEALTDLVLPFTNTNRSKEESYDFLVEIYNDRIGIKAKQ